MHTLKPNRVEAALLTGVDITGRRSLRTAAEALLDAGVQQVVISLGAEGVFFADAEMSGTLAPPQETIESVTGAGDALMAGLVYAHVADLPIEEAVRFALAAAAVTAASVSPVATGFSTETILDVIKKEAL